MATCSLTEVDIEAIAKVLTNVGINFFVSPSASTFLVTLGNSSLYIDSSYCNHMTSNSSLFSTKSLLSNAATIITANNSTMDVSHIEFISISNLSVSQIFS